MSNQTFVEKKFGAKTGKIVFRKPHVVPWHDHSVRIRTTFKKTGEGRILDPDRKLVVLYSDAPPISTETASIYRTLFLNKKEFKFAPLPDKLRKVIVRKGLVNWIKAVA